MARPKQQRWGEGTVTQGVQPGQRAFELVSEGVAATLWAPPPGDQGWSNGGQGALGLGQGVGTPLQERAVQAWVMLDRRPPCIAD